MEQLKNKRSTQAAKYPYLRLHFSLCELLGAIKLEEIFPLFLFTPTSVGKDSTSEVFLNCWESLHGRLRVSGFSLQCCPKAILQREPWGCFSLTISQVPGLCYTRHCTAIVVPQNNNLHTKSWSVWRMPKGISETVSARMTDSGTTVVRFGFGIQQSPSMQGKERNIDC